MARFLPYFLQGRQNISKRVRKFQGELGNKNIAEVNPLLFNFTLLD